MKLLDPDDPFFRKPWVRWGVILAPLLWAGVEFMTGAPAWGIGFLAAGLYALWALVLNRR